MFDPTWFLRTAIASVFLYHGLTKDADKFAESFALPMVTALAVIFAEVAGGMGYLIGGVTKCKPMGLTVTQWSSVAVIPVLLGAIFMVHWKKGFNVMNGGYEFQFTLLMVALYLLFRDKDEDKDNQ